MQDGNDDNIPLRRRVESITDDRIFRLENRIDAIDHMVRIEMSTVDAKIKSAMEIVAISISEKAVDMAVHRAFAHFGVDVDDPAQLHRLREDMNFGRNARTIIMTGMLSIFGTLCGAIGLYFFNKYILNIGQQ